MTTFYKQTNANVRAKVNVRPRWLCGLRVKNTHTAACDLIRGNKSTALFPRVKSQAAGRSAPPRCMCVFLHLGVCLLPLRCWDRGFEFCWEHRCLSLVFLV